MDEVLLDTFVTHMTHGTGHIARITFVLILCLLTAGLPSRALHVNLCACHGLVTGAACPCDDADASTCCDRCETPEPPSCCGEDEPTDEGSSPCGDGCCHEVGLEEITLPSGERPDFSDDIGVESPYGEAPAEVDVPRSRRAACVLATGPPFGHRWRRMLTEHASVVLLI